MANSPQAILAKFLGSRSQPMMGRFHGHYRAMVVETNDPLDMHRVRFKCPELHDYNLKPEDCPWAMPMPGMGGKRAGEWRHPCIGDWVWIAFERDHPYCPIWTGFATPSRRKFYTYPSVYGMTPLPVDSQGSPASQPSDYSTEYLPQDGRPMNIGMQDRYGSIDMLSAVGFFPVEHAQAPPIPDNDPVQGMGSSGASSTATPFNQSDSPPQVNNPDCKFSLRMSKYGSMFLQADQGYYWQKKTTGSFQDNNLQVADDGKGEFTGDCDLDESWEIKRWLYLQRLINEDKPQGYDQRRQTIQTRYGTKIELRDVGWNKTREGEYDDKPRKISETTDDFRWLKLRTKGGWLIQAYDKGFDPEKDLFIKRKLIDEVGTKTEQEDVYWADKDARWFRIVGRHGFKFVIDERGTDPKDADNQELPQGNGMLWKGRRTGGAQGKPASGSPIGFYWEFNENDSTNQTTWGTPLGTTLQLNDKIQYAMLATRRSDYPRPWQGLKENEFLLESLVSNDTELSTHHLKLDLHNEYIRFKTRAGQGDSPFGDPVNQPQTGENQGLEARDGQKDDGPWVEIVDINRRGLWFWGQKGFVICRAQQDPNKIKLYWWMDETKKELIIKCSESTGRVQIASDGGIDIQAKKDIFVYAQGTATVKSTKRVVVVGGGGKLEINSSGIVSSKTVYAPLFVGEFAPGGPPGVQVPRRPKLASVPSKVEPTDRGKRYNNDLEQPANQDDIEHPTQ